MCLVCRFDVDSGVKYYGKNGYIPMILKYLKKPALYK